MTVFMPSPTSATTQFAESFTCTPSMAEEELTDVYMNLSAFPGSLNRGFVSNKDFRFISYYTTL